MILDDVLHVFSTSIYSNKIILAVVSIAIFVIIIDTSLIKIYDFITSQSTSTWRTTVFIIISATCAILQYIILRFVKQKNNEIGTKEKLHLNTIHKIVTIVQYTLTTILVFVILQIFLGQYYNVAMLTAAVTISYMLTVIMMGILSQRFFSWFKSNRSSVVLLYGLSSTTLAINAGFTVVLVCFILLGKPQVAVPHVGANFPALIPGSVIYILNQLYTISSIVSFILTWVATAVLLHHYSQTLGRVKYWIIVVLPLVYFLSQFLSLFLNLLLPLLQSDPIFFAILFTFIFSLSNAAGGIFFGIAFWTMAKSIKRSNIVRDYLTISAYGIVILFISNQAIVLTSIPYPPFGIATITFTGLASYLMLVGIYSSAISVSQDVKLRQSIRKILVKESKLLDSIGTAQMQQEIQRRVMRITKEHQGSMEEETGVQSSLNEEDIKEYLDEVMQEIRAKK